MRRIIISVLLLGLGHLSHADIAPRELTPSEAVATTRILPNQVSPGSGLDSQFTSPDGRRYVLRLAHGDPTLNGVWVDVWTGSLDSLAAATPRRCGHLLTTGLGPHADNMGANWDPTSENALKWLNALEVAFLWSDSHGIRQVMAVNLKTCRHRFLTHESGSVYAFTPGANGELLIDALEPAPKLPRLWEDGFTLPQTDDAWAVLRDQIGAGNIYDVNDRSVWTLLAPHGNQEIRVGQDRVDVTNPSFRPLITSPDRRLVITHIGLKSLPEAWHAYTNPFVQSMFAVNQDSPGDIPLTYVVIDLIAHRVHPLLNTPRAARDRLQFSPGSQSILIAPAFLPLPTQDTVGLSGNAAVVVDARSGMSEPVTIDLSGRVVTHLRFISDEHIEIDSTNPEGVDAREQMFQRRDHQWVPVSEAPTPEPMPHVRIEVRQNLNTPPTVWAVSRNGERQLMDPNPHLTQRFRLGRVERRSGVLADGHRWLAQLIYPANYLAGARYPLLIQSLYSYRWGPEEFSLDGTWGLSGMGLGPSEYASYPGQLLASRNIAVLQLELLSSSTGVKEPEEHQRLFETLAEDLSASGLIDRNKIALAGFSRNGYWVEYTLAHSDFPFAAAIAADNYDPSYFQSALSGWRPEDVEMNGAPAFGSGLEQWLLRAPGFNADHIHTPLRLVGQAIGGVAYLMAEWEIYSRLKYLKRPVEISVMPDINRHPSHNTQNPRQIMALQESALDWVSFWLTGREDPNPGKREQYARWHKFRQLQESSAPRVVQPQFDVKM